MNDPLASFQVCCDAMTDEALASAIDELLASRPSVQAKRASKGVSAELSLPDAAYAVRMGAMREVAEGRVVTVCEVSELPVGKTLYPLLISAVVCPDRLPS